eukprot:758573-Hanusia_phi.AAC.5
MRRIFGREARQRGRKTGRQAEEWRARGGGGQGRWKGPRAHLTAKIDFVREDGFILFKRLVDGVIELRIAVRPL